MAELLQKAFPEVMSTEDEDDISDEELRGVRRGTRPTRPGGDTFLSRRGIHSDDKGLLSGLKLKAKF